MSCEHHWHDEGIWEYCCECNAHKCEAIQRVRELADKFDSSSHYTGHFITDAILKALDGEQ